ncbi:MAG: formylglycine-generating enzyme family protein [Wenzhouxiangella sp.]|nr:MAG: formylglycine-generating enzyme family protein [Wenzhouxiangella sp.]
MAGNAYEFQHESDTGGTYITLTDPSNNILQHGPSPQLLLATSSGSIRLHYSNDEICTPTPGDCRIGRATTRFTAIFSDRFEAGFKDCDDCPIMVMIPAGRFTQGSPVTEPSSVDWERPQREVSVPAFAMGQTAVTFAEWDACVADGACTRTPADNGWGRGERPVMNVARVDMQQFIDWLSQKTGKPYRLPSESEWEYAARAGSTGRFNTGDCITTDQANFDGTTPAPGCPAGVLRDQTVPVRSFPANAFGLHEVHGNLWEATEDCWNESYEDAPIDGSAWLTGNCELHVLRGGAWYTVGSDARSAYRDRAPRSSASNFIGFRIARSMSP